MKSSNCIFPNGKIPLLLGYISVCRSMISMASFFVLKSLMSLIYNLGEKSVSYLMALCKCLYAIRQAIWWRFLHSREVTSIRVFWKMNSMKKACTFLIGMISEDTDRTTQRFIINKLIKNKGVDKQIQP